jgi:hypothetical protein
MRIEPNHMTMKPTNGARRFSTQRGQLGYADSVDLLLVIMSYAITNLVFG